MLLTLLLLLMFVSRCCPFHLHPSNYILGKSLSTLQAESPAFYSKQTIPVPNTTTNTSITSTKFTVYGEPVALARHRMTKRGFSYNPSSKSQASFLKAAAPFLPAVPLTGPLQATIVFHFTRPKAHYRTGKFAHIMKENADLWHHKKSDIDNLVKFVLDALNSVAYEDDAQIALLSCAKVYADDEPHIDVEIKPLAPDSLLNNHLQIHQDFSSVVSISGSDESPQ